jgi:hypothetical protein
LAVRAHVTFSHYYSHWNGACCFGTSNSENAIFLILPGTDVMIY